ncbi:MAG: hypothetical protein Q8R20_03360 [Nanoarchaeota archaeon]|nr:hypothetical protein [Nanoarchaeota archaeon]
MKNRGRENGQITLPFILLVGGIIMEIALAGVFVAYFLSTSNLGERLAARAASAAYSGIQDAMVNITRNKEYGNTSYVLEIKDDKTTVNVSRTQDPQGAYAYIIESLGEAGSRQKKLVATLIVNNVSGKTTLQSLLEVPARQ